MIRSLAAAGIIAEESIEEYRPGVLCPEFSGKDGGIWSGVWHDDKYNDWELLGDHEPPNDTIKGNIDAVENYTAALCDKLRKNLEDKLAAKVAAAAKPRVVPEIEVKPDLEDKSDLNYNVRKNLEKVAAKSFSPLFVQTKAQAKTQGESFQHLMEHAKQRTEKYAPEPQTSREQFAEKQAKARTDDPLKADRAAGKNDAGQEYKVRVMARLSVYSGWEFKNAGAAEGEDKPSDPNVFILVNSSQNQEITVTKQPNGAFTIKSTGEAAVTDETIGIMIELSHNVLRFSKNSEKMKMTIKGVDETHAIGGKFKEGLHIINDSKNSKDKLKYTFENTQDSAGKGPRPEPD